MKKIYEALQLKMKLSTGDTKKSIFRDVKNIFDTDFKRFNKNAIAIRVEKMTDLIKERRISSLRETLKNSKRDTFINEIDLDNINVDTINFILNQWNSDKDLNEYNSTVKYIEFEISNKTETIKQMKRNELNRVCKEYFKNDYERRFKVPIETIIAALVGEENFIYEITNYKKMQRVHNVYLAILY